MTSTLIIRLGTIDWIDLTAPEIDPTQDFYRSVLGWSHEASTTPMGTYYIANAGGHEAAGLMASAPGQRMPPAWTVFVRVSSADDTLAAAETAGGTAVAPAFDIPGGARIGVLSGPDGAMLAVISGGPEPAADEPPLRRNAPGAVGWCELLTRDPHAALSFYDALFGWMVVRDDATGYSVFRLGDRDVAGLLPMPQEMPAEAPTHWLVHFHVADLDTAVSTAERTVGMVARPPAEIGGVRFAVLSDPNGAVFGLLQLP